MAENDQAQKFGQRTRVALWHAIEAAFGSVLRDQMAEPYWSEEIEALEENVRKRLRILELAPRRYVPDAVQGFIVERATPDQLLAVAEEALRIGIRSRMPPDRLKELKVNLEEAIREGGVDDEFRKALDDYRKGDTEDCVAKCGSAFESVLKVLCQKNGIPFDANKDTAGPLLKTKA